jgi:glycosyltransferase involved in cell wall biosynthesis
MLFSIVIPTHNNATELQRCLRSLESLQPADFEVIVCVDGSTDGTIAMLEKYKAPFPLITATHVGNQHKGRSATRNLALKHLSASFTLFLDSDMTASPDLLTAHLKVLRNSKTVSLGLVKYENEAENVWARYISERGIGKFKHGEKVPFHYFITPNTAMPTEWWKALNGFDEDMKFYGGEDMEMGLRIKEKFNPEFRFNAEAFTTTVQEKPLDDALDQLQKFGATSMRYLTKKHPILNTVYWVNKCNSKKFGDQLFEFLTISPFMQLARFLIRIFPFFLQRPLINYLVIANVHRGYRNDK